MSVSPLVAAAGGSHLALPNATARGTYPKHVREVISSTSLYNQTQSDEKKESAKLCRSESGEGDDGFHERREILG